MVYNEYTIEPDGELSYEPDEWEHFSYFWRYIRNVKMDGEHFFSVGLLERLKKQNRSQKSRTMAFFAYNGVLIR